MVLTSKNLITPIMKAVFTIFVVSIIIGSIFLFISTQRTHADFRLALPIGMVFLTPYLTSPIIEALTAILLVLVASDGVATQLTR
jgi:hypothetical protein